MSEHPYRPCFVPAIVPAIEDCPEDVIEAVEQGLLRDALALGIVITPGPCPVDYTAAGEVVWNEDFGTHAATVAESIVISAGDPDDNGDSDDDTPIIVSGAD